MKRSLLFSVLMLIWLGGLGQEAEQDTPAAAQMEQMQQMEARMQAMQALMQQIRATEDPEERRRLMQEHMQSMHEGMMMMGRMMREPMGPGRAQGAAPGAGGGRMRQCQQDDTECRMNQMQMQQGMMGQRMGMMHQMVEQMMERMMLEQGIETAEAENQD